MDEKVSVNVSEALIALEQISTEIHRRLEMVLDHTHGPRPVEAEKGPQSPGLIGSLERLATTLQKTERATTRLENVLGARPMANGMVASNQSGALVGATAGYVSRY